MVNPEAKTSPLLPDDSLETEPERLTVGIDFFDNVVI